MKSGSERTRAMTEVVNDMIEVLRGSQNFDVKHYLQQQDRGLRLAAYAYLHEHSQPELVPALVEATLREDKPFGELLQEMLSLCDLRFFVHCGSRHPITKTIGARCYRVTPV